MKYPFKRRYNKFGNKTTHCFSNHLHDSILEATYCNQLLKMKEEGDILSYEKQVTFDLDVNGVHITRHRVDFVVETPKGKEVHEVKGFATMMWDMKRRLFKAVFPEIPYIVITKHEIYGIPKRKRKIRGRKKDGYQQSLW